MHDQCFVWKLEVYSEYMMYIFLLNYMLLPFMTIAVLLIKTQVHPDPKLSTVLQFTVPVIMAV